MKHCFLQYVPKFVLDRVVVGSMSYIELQGQPRCTCHHEPGTWPWYIFQMIHVNKMPTEVRHQFATELDYESEAISNDSKMLDN